LALIRSFLLDSGVSTPSRKARCAKFFCCAHKRYSIACAVKKARARALFLCASTPRAHAGDAQDILISS
jgi:hypothetical protein